MATPAITPAEIPATAAAENPQVKLAIVHCGVGPEPMQPLGKEHSTLDAGHEMLLLVHPTPSTHRSLVHESPSGQARGVVSGWQLGCVPGPGMQMDGKQEVLTDGQVTFTCTHPVTGSHESMVHALLSSQFSFVVVGVQTLLVHATL